MKFSRIETDEQYKQALQRLDEIIDQNDEDEEIEELSEMIYQYESEKFPIPPLDQKNEN